MWEFVRAHAATEPGYGVTHCGLRIADCGFAVEVRAATRRSISNPQSTIHNPECLDDVNALRYYPHVIRSFRDKDAERLFRREPIRKLPRAIQRVALRKLVQLDAAAALDDLRIPPGNRLGKLSGTRAGQHSIRINDQWRVCFRWHQGDAHDGEIVDYH